MQENLIYSPTPFSTFFNAVAETETAELEKEMSSGFVGKVKFQARIKTYLLKEYRALYGELNAFALPALGDDSKENLLALKESFEALYTKIIFNNIALATLVEDGSFSVQCETKEDEKNHLLQNIAAGEDEACEEFKNAFGHYALGAYEAAEKRFSEYSCEELEKIARPMSLLSLAEKTSMEKFFEENTGRANASHLVSIREYGKFRALEIVAAFRRELLKIEKVRELEKSVFDYSLEELLEQLGKS